MFLQSSSTWSTWVYGEFINLVVLLLLVLTTNVQSEVGDGALTVLTRAAETVHVAPDTLLLVDGPDSISELAGVSLAHGGFQRMLMTPLMEALVRNHLRCFSG